MQNVLVTGGAGFIGSHLVDLLLGTGANVVVLDLLTYAGNLDNLAEASVSSQYKFVRGDICDTELVKHLLSEHNIDTVFHLAAESHVDNSIANPGKFIETNVNGTFSMLYAGLQYWEGRGKQDNFRFIHVSTDEVFGQLQMHEPAFNEDTPYKPNSPYSASKAASDLIVRSWYHTYKFPAIITNCSNNFGSRQHNEKLIPTVVRTALAGKSIPIYGTGNNVRDWLYVKDHCQGLMQAGLYGKVGENYCFGGKNELQNNDLVMMICRILDQIKPNINCLYSKSIVHVEDRKGHDFRYAIDPRKAQTELAWNYSANFTDDLYATIKHYVVFNSIVKETHVL